jgi:hypothetical protein
MLVPGSANPLLLRSAAAPAAGGISRSLRFNSSDSAYLSRTPASAGNRKTWTWAGWVKLALTATNGMIWTCLRPGGGEGGGIYFTSANRIDVYEWNGGSVNWRAQTSALYRDVAAWFHLVVTLDTTQATSSNRLRLYINGSEVTAFNSVTYPSQNYDAFLNNNVAHSIGREASGAFYFNGYLADIYFIDGQALTPSSFTETDATTGQLIPKAFSGSYGSQGWHLEFADNSSNTATTLGKDTSGNGNNWTPNNLSVTAGAGNDSLVDVPTNGSQTDTGVGGEVRGNYCTLNPLVKASTTTLSNGNLDASFSGWQSTFGTIAYPKTGKWYYEFAPGNVDGLPGIADVTANLQSATGTFFTGAILAYAYYGSGNKSLGPTNTQSAYGATFTTGDVIGVAFDADAGTLVFYKNGVSQGTAFSGLTGSYIPAVGQAGGGVVVNFGQRPFAYTAPSGFKALNTANLPAPTIVKPHTVMDVKLYTGNGATQTISGLNFESDLLWIKRRDGANSHQLTDSVRGLTKYLFSDATLAEETRANQVTATSSTGFSLGSNAAVNASAGSYVAWAWDAGASTVTNNSGTITSQVRANASAGFSIVTYTGSGANSTIGHGLGVAPQFIITKSRSSSAFNWGVYHASAGNTGYLKLNLTDAFATQATWQNTTPTSAVFYVGNFNSANQGGDNYVAYCFAPVVGYSSFGSYTGNGSTDGPFVYTGFRPSYLLIKQSSTSGQNWEVRDYAREPYNDSNRTVLFPSSSLAEVTDAFPIDLLSNGFKVRNTGDGTNGSGATYIYAAFAESPFNYARAR